MDAEFLRFVGTAAVFLALFVLVRRVTGANVRGGRPAVSGGASAGGAGASHGTTGVSPLSPASPPSPFRQDVPAPAHHEALDRIAAQAVLLRRHVPPRRDSLSFWGGVPVVPPGFEWPQFAPEAGSPRALSFLMQVDCATIPIDARLGLMPDHGILYFFLDLHWGVHWKWRVLHLDGDRSSFAPAIVPATLPRAYGERWVWRWPRQDDEWPRLLPRFSFDPVLVRGRPLPPFRGDEDDERFVWPGSLDVATAVEGIEGAVVDSRSLANRFEDGVVQRPYASFPQDWQAVRITLGHLAQLRQRGHLDRMASRPGAATEAEGVRVAVEDGIARWAARVDAEDPVAALEASDREAFWDFLVSVQPVSRFALGDAAKDSLDATLSSSDAPESLLDEDAMAIARARHALAVRSEGSLHVRLANRMLCPPTDVQGEAAELAREWLLLLEVSSEESIGHHLSEGVLKFFIRPEDLAARRFDRVDLVASAY